MFIDDVLVSSFYDAVLRPSYRTRQIELSKEEATTATEKTSFGIKAAEIMPGLAVTLGGELSTSESTKRGESSTLEPIENAPRKLIRLALHYLDNYYNKDGTAGDTQASRIWEELGDPRNGPWKPPEEAWIQIQGQPRMLAFLDFHKRTKFIPMALETEHGVNPVYEKLVKKLQKPEGPPCPSYPLDPDDPNFKQKTNEYWRWFDDNWDAMAALVVLEKAAQFGGRPRWVNYRVPVQDGLTLHLNVVGYGNYDTGIFGYSLIRRGWRHGLRIVGTVRTEPALNVMAIYDK
jgi:hypothetical protein